MRTPEQAVAWAAQQADNPSQSWFALCLSFCRQAYGVPAKYASAADAWAATRLRGDGPAPFGAPCWWTGGSGGYGHVVLATGDGRCWSSDFGPNGYIGDGKIRRVSIVSVHQSVSGLVFRGWSRDINDVVVLEEDDMADLTPEERAALHVWMQVWDNYKKLGGESYRILEVLETFRRSHPKDAAGKATHPGGTAGPHEHNVTGKAV